MAPAVPYILAIAAAAAAGSSYLSYEAQQEAAEDAEDAAEAAAQQAIEDAALAEQQLSEQHALDISLAEEQLKLEEEIHSESVRYVTEQIAERDARVRAAAIAGYSASGVNPYEEDSSALSVLGSIKEQSLSEQERVMKGFETFLETRNLELSQLKESTEKTFGWFMERTQFELEYELESRYNEASMFRKQAGYANWGSYLGPIGSLGSSLTIT